jgi:hypothetical protein
VKKSKIISLEKFNDWLDKNREYVTLGSTDGKAGWNLKGNYKNKPFKCGCGQTHKFIPDYTTIWWRRLFTDGKMILQQPGCDYICYIEMKGAFIIDFETLYSAKFYSVADQLFLDPRKDQNYSNFMSLIKNQKIK